VRRFDEREEVKCNEGDKLEDMMHDVNEYFMDDSHLFESLNNDKTFIVGSKSLSFNCIKSTSKLLIDTKKEQNTNERIKGKREKIKDYK